MDVLNQIFVNLILSITLMLLINIFIKDFFDRLTRYDDYELHTMSSKFVTLYIFFGFIMLIFYKKVREYRKVYYMKNYIRQMEWMNLTGLNVAISGDKYDKKYNNFKRYLKLKKVRNKSKRIF